MTAVRCWCFAVWTSTGIISRFCETPSFCRNWRMTASIRSSSNRSWALCTRFPSGILRVRITDHTASRAAIGCKIRRNCTVTLSDLDGSQNRPRKIEGKLKSLPPYPVRNVGEMLNCSSPLLRHWARSWIGHLSLWRIAGATPNLWLPFHSKDVAALRLVPGGTCVCEQLARGCCLAVERPGVELTTSWVASQVQRLHHHTTGLKTPGRRDSNQFLAE